MRYIALIHNNPAAWQALSQENATSTTATPTSFSSGSLSPASSSAGPSCSPNVEPEDGAAPPGDGGCEGRAVRELSEPVRRREAGLPPAVRAKGADEREPRSRLSLLEPRRWS